MPDVPAWLLPLLLFGVWFLWIFAAVAEVRAREAREGTPAERREHVSILPIFPLFPLLFWGVARLVDRWLSPWGTVVVGALHLVLAAMMVFTLVRDVRCCRQHAGRA